MSFSAKTKLLTTGFEVTAFVQNQYREVQTLQGSNISLQNDMTKTVKATITKNNFPQQMIKITTVKKNVIIVSPDQGMYVVDGYGLAGFAYKIIEAQNCADQRLIRPYWWLPYSSLQFPNEAVEKVELTDYMDSYAVVSPGVLAIVAEGFVVSTNN